MNLDASGSHRVWRRFTTRWRGEIDGSAFSMIKPIGFKRESTSSSRPCKETEVDGRLQRISPVCRDPSHRSLFPLFVSTRAISKSGELCHAKILDIFDVLRVEQVVDSGRKDSERAHQLVAKAHLLRAAFTYFCFWPFARSISRSDSKTPLAPALIQRRCRWPGGSRR